MSYILEALKRAEADRNAAQATTSIRRWPPAITASRSRWPWLVGGALVLNVLIGGTVFVFTRGSSPTVNAPPATEPLSPLPVERSPLAPAPLAVESPEAKPLKTSTPPTAKPADGAAPRTRRPDAPVAASPHKSPPPARTPGTVATESAATQPSKPPVTSAERPRPAPPAQTAIATTPPAPTPPASQGAIQRPQLGTTVPAAPETPATDLQVLANTLKIEVLLWADDPKDRMIFMNGRKYVEGQALASGVVIERIGEDGIVLVREGQRVRVKAQTK